MTSFTPRRKSIQKVSASKGPMAMPITSRRPSPLTPTAMVTATRRRGPAKDRLKPRTTLVRGWHGGTHTLAVRAEGFEYRGRLYRSLSLIAREITGAHWSGPRFFGLIDKPSVTRPRTGRTRHS